MTTTTDLGKILAEEAARSQVEAIERAEALRRPPDPSKVATNTHPGKSVVSDQRPSPAGATVRRGRD